MRIAASVFTLLAGLGVFLLGMKLISTNLQCLAGGKIKTMLGKISDRRFAGVGLGAGASFVLQSSTAATVLLLGLVNAGLVDLTQAALIIMGANVGTTFTVLLFSFGSLPVGEILSFFALAGVILVMTAKKDKTVAAGWAVSGFGLIFIGLDLMGGSVDALKDSPLLAKFLLSIDHPAVLVFAGLLFAAVTQSSSATTGTVITLSTAGLMPVTSAFCVIMGSNIGTCVTALLAGIGTSLNARRTAFIHLLFNAAGVLLFFPILLFGREAVGRLLLNTVSPALAIAYFHIVFNVVSALALVPFARPLAAFAERCISPKKEEPPQKEEPPKIKTQKIIRKTSCLLSCLCI